ncbi:MAG: formylglycine-generating enzyme family protein [Tannerella sp.]|nr:formylglycine-generating enzyme family protein [Tannerella sp.]
MPALLLLFITCKPSVHPGESEMVFVEGGKFTMGCTSEQENDCNSDEKPAHSVTVSSFQIGKYEVTQTQWEAVMKTASSCFKGDNHPVELVSWDDVQEFISRLNAATGKNYRLPTEAEWEYAARGGNRSQGYKYSGSNNPDEVAWCGEKFDVGHTRPVGMKQANELGIHDMSGNVMEWCQNWYGEYSASSQQNPEGAVKGSCRVFRGGLWWSGSYDGSMGGCRITYREYQTPGFSSCGLGFRVACSAVD